MTMQTMTDYQKRLRDEAAEKFGSLFLKGTSKTAAQTAFERGHDFAFERAKVLVEALEAIANQDYRGNMPPGMREACEALRVYREGNK